MITTTLYFYFLEKNFSVYVLFYFIDIYFIFFQKETKKDVSI
jgi:hypothetical protein